MILELIRRFDEYYGSIQISFRVPSKNKHNTHYLLFYSAEQYKLQKNRQIVIAIVNG